MKKGFTLIELIFVIVIIGILGAVALPKFASIKANAKAKTLAQLYTTMSRNIPTQVMSSVELDGAQSADLQLADYIDVPAGWFCERGAGDAASDIPMAPNFKGNTAPVAFAENNLSGGVCHFTQAERSSNGFMFKIGLNADGSATGVRHLYYYIESNSATVPEAAVKLYKDLARKAIRNPAGEVVDSNNSVLNTINTDMNATTDAAIKALLANGTGVFYVFKSF